MSCRLHEEAGGDDRGARPACRPGRPGSAGALRARLRSSGAGAGNRTVSGPDTPVRARMPRLRLSGAEPRSSNALPCARHGEAGCGRRAQRRRTASRSTNDSVQRPVRERGGTGRRPVRDRTRRPRSLEMPRRPSRTTSVGPPVSVSEPASTGPVQGRAREGRGPALPGGHREHGSASWPRGTASAGGRGTSEASRTGSSSIATRTSGASRSGDGRRILVRPPPRRRTSHRPRPSRDRRRPSRCRPCRCRPSPRQRRRSPLPFR